MPLPSVPASARPALSRRAALGLFVPLALGAAWLGPTPRRVRAESQPTDDPGGPAVDTDQGLIFVTGVAPAAAGNESVPTVPHEWVVRFTGPYEQTLTLYQWSEPTAGDAGKGGAAKGGCWKRRTFLNSYYQGAAATLAVDLAAGQRFLLVAYHKDAAPPAMGQDWAQSRLDHGDVTRMTERRPYPLVEAVFKHDKGSTLVWLRPEARPSPATQPGPSTRPGPSSRPTSGPSDEPK